MRCHLKPVVRTVVGLIILTSVGIYIRRTQWPEHTPQTRRPHPQTLGPSLDTASPGLGFFLDSTKVVLTSALPAARVNKESQWSRYIVMPLNSSSKPCPEDVVSKSLCLPASIRLLAGFISKEQKYLTLGLSSVKRKKENYLLKTLNSIFSQSSEEESSQMVVVVLLADFNLNWVQETLNSIKKQFSSRLTQGQLLIIHSDQELYPLLTGLKRNFNDAPDRVTFRSKQNVDYAFLVDFSSGLSQYYIMLEDDVICSKGFLTAIRGHVNSQGSSPWATLEFSKLGYIGKLYRSHDLPRLAQFLYLFYQEMPCDFLLSHFRTLLMQDKVIRFRPSLFQHMGTYSSFQGIHNRLKDEDFHQDPADNPPADVHSNIEVFENHSPDEAYSQGMGYFWGKSPLSVGNYFLIAFHEPVALSHILIQTGLEGKDLLNSADVEVGETVLKTKDGVDCAKCHILGSLSEGQFEHLNVQKMIQQPVLCLRIRVTGNQTNWIIIRNIQVWAVKDTIKVTRPTDKP